MEFKKDIKTAIAFLRELRPVVTGEIKYSGYTNYQAKKLLALAITQLEGMNFYGLNEEERKDIAEDEI